MKKISILFLSLVAFTGFTSCDDTNSEDINLDVNKNGTVKLSNGGGTYIVSESNIESLADVFAWNELTTDVPVAVTYTLQMDVAGGDFSNPAVVGSTGNTSFAVKYSDLNNLALSERFDGTPEVIANYSVRLIATMADPAIAPAISNVIDVTITPFSAYPFKDLYLVGAATAAMWNNDNNNPALFRDPSNPNVYTYTGRFLQEEFKVLTMPGFWQPQYGVRNGAVGLNDGGPGGQDPSNFASPATGFFKFTIDITGVTNDSQGTSSFSIVPFTGSTTTTYTSIGILGTSFANGFNAPDLDLVKSTFDPHQWSLRNVAFTDGEFKFRANDDWSTNWGDTSMLTGTGSFNGPNIPVEAGTYDIFFNDLTGQYIIIPSN